MGNEAQRVHLVPVEQQIHLHQLAGPVAGELVVQGGVALRVRLQRVEEIVNNLVQRHLVMELHQVGVQVLHVLELPPALLAHGHDVAHVVVGGDDGHLHIGLLRPLDGSRVRVIMGIVHPDQATVRFINIINYGR